MNQKSLLVLVAAMAAPSWTVAADSAKPGLPAKPVPPFELKNKSTFTTNGITRNPFIPIGYQAPVPTVGAGVAAPKATVTADSFQVSSILLGGGGAPSLAVINKRSYEEGQMIRMPKTGPQVRAKVFRITDGSVQIQVENDILTVPLHRGELNEKRPDEPLSTDKE
jgi:hypothetical protein